MAYEEFGGGITYYAKRRNIGDFATIIGIFSGFFLLFYAIYDGGGFKIFLNVNSLLITVGGSAAAILISYPMGEVLNVFVLAVKIFYRQVRNPEELAKDIVQLAFLSRKGGNLSLSREENLIGDSFLRYSISLVVDGIDPAIIKDLMEIEIDSIRARHQKGQKICRSIAAFGPAFGLIGTLIGLIQMLSNLQDVAKIGPSMAVAMITTFYGAIMANLIFLPMAEKLEDKMEEEIFIMRLVAEGIISLRRNINPKIIEKKLNAFLRTSKRFSLNLK